MGSLWLHIKFRASSASCSGRRSLSKTEGINLQAFPQRQGVIILRFQYVKEPMRKVRTKKRIFKLILGKI